MLLTSNIVPTGTASVSTKSIVNSTSASGFAGAGITNSNGLGTVSTNTGALTANTLATMLDLTGAAGTMQCLTVRTVDATARTIRVKITIDGVTAYDKTSASISTANNGIMLCGQIGVAYPNYVPPIKWKTAIKIEVASSVTETASFTFEWAYNTEG